LIGRITDQIWLHLFHKACLSNDKFIIRKLIDTKGNVNVANIDDGRSPVHYATEVKIKDGSMAKENPNDEVRDSTLHFAPDNDEETPLHLLEETSNTNIVRLLMKKNADITATDESGLTALHCAVMNGNSECAKILIEEMIKKTNGDHTTRW